MTRFPHDQFAKDFLESLLSPLGQVQTSLKISGEIREMDVYFTPNASLSSTSDLGLAIKEVAALPAGDRYRQNVLDLLGNISPEVQVQIKTLPLARLEALGEALLDFTSAGDFDRWLDS